MTLLYEAVLWSGRFALVLLVLNFATCYVMPWARRCPELHRCPGPACPFPRRPLCYYHRPFVWLTVGAVGLHVVLALML